MEGDTILSKSCRPVERFDLKLWEIMDDLKDTMYFIKAIGLAAPHIGMLRRFISVDIGDGFFEIANPEIVDQSGEQAGVEGSVSAPGEKVYIKRPMIVKVKGYNRNGEEIEVFGRGLKAKVLCHEIDQLDGIYFKTKAFKKY